MQEAMMESQRSPISPRPFSPLDDAIHFLINFRLWFLRSGCDDDCFMVLRGDEEPAVRPLGDSPYSREASVEALLLGRELQSQARHPLPDWQGRTAAYSESYMRSDASKGTGAAAIRCGKEIWCYGGKDSVEGLAILLFLLNQGRYMNDALVCMVLGEHKAHQKILDLFQRLSAAMGFVHSEVPHN